MPRTVQSLGKYLCWLSLVVAANVFPADRMIKPVGASLRSVPQATSASMKLTSSPSEEILNPKGDPNCSQTNSYYQQLNLEEDNGFEVYLNRFLLNGNDESDQIAHWFGTRRLAPFGALQAQWCWQVPAQTEVDYEIDGTDSNGNPVSATMSVQFQGPLTSAGTLATSTQFPSLTAAPSKTAATTLEVNVPAGQDWSVSVFPANQRTAWLKVTPASGTGSAKVNLTASAAGLQNQAYVATLIFQSLNTTPQFVDATVTFGVGISASMSIDGIGNGASFQQSAAPGMVLSAFGTNLANSTVSAVSVPLPFSMDGVSAVINGVPAPLYYVSPSQLNMQVPYEIGNGAAVLGISNHGSVAGLLFTAVTPTAPGIFVDSQGDLVPDSAGARGSNVTFFITGDGDVSPPLPTGQAPSDKTPVDQLPAPIATLSMTIGGMAVTPSFVGIPYGLVGVTQINVTVPENAPTGIQPVVVTADGVSSPPANITVQ